MPRQLIRAAIPPIRSLYLAIALLTDGRPVTADSRLFQAGRRKAPLRNRVLWVEDIPA